LITPAKWIPAVACAGSGKVDLVGGSERGAQGVGRADVGQRVAPADGDSGRDRGDIGHGGGHDVAALCQRVDQSAAQDHDVGRLAGQQPVAHRADRAEGAVDRAAGAGLE